MNFIRDSLNKKSSRGRGRGRGRFRNDPIFHNIFRRTSVEQPTTSSTLAHSNISTLLHSNQGQVLSTVERNSSGSRSTEHAFRSNQGQVLSTVERNSSGSRSTELPFRGNQGQVLSTAERNSSGSRSTELPFGGNQGQVLSTAERNSSGSRSTEHAFCGNQGPVLSTAERNSSGSRSTEHVFRTPRVSALFRNRLTNSDPQIIDDVVAECLNTPNIPPTSASSNSKISIRQQEVLRSIPPPNSGDCSRKPRSSTSSGAKPRSTPSHSNSGTPRTPRTPKTTSSLESVQNVIIAITEGRGLARGEVGMAAMDTHRPFLVLCQISDSQTYTNSLTKINVLHPTEILLPNTFVETQEKNKLFTLIHEHFPQVSITTVQRCHFNDTTGLQHVQSLCLTECANVEMVVRQKYYALSATAALLKYIEFQRNIIFSPKSLRIEYQSPENVMFIDMKTAQKLELVTSLNGRGPYGSLLSVLDHCSTVGGRRSLRANILQPPTSLDTINSRLLSVTELAQNPALLHSLQSAVSKFCDAEQLLWLCAQVPNFKEEQKASELQTNFVLLLKTTLESLPVLRESLQGTQTPYFRKVLKDLDNEKFEPIMNTILEVVNDDAKTKKGYAASTFQRCFAIKSGVNGLLDLHRASYSDLVGKLHERVNAMAEEFGLALRMCSTSNKGFHIQMSVNRKAKFSVKDLPPVFIQVSRTRNLISMTTEELVVLNHRIKQLLLEIQMQSNIIMQELLRKLRTHISCLYCLCEEISELDLLISFAQVSSADDFVAPTFSNKMDIKNSRHPILDVICSSTPVANDIFASPGKNFHIITGPNMGGKSIYIKQVALLQVMAQVGCFIPAESAQLRITKQLFSRIGFDDSIEYNASSFDMEMQEMQYILRSMGPECLIIIDELCRSTDWEEGTAVAWVLCEQLLESKAFVFFTTHYLTLSKLQSLYSNVTNHQMVAECGPHDRLVYTHKLRPGVTRVALYGLKLAQMTGMPASVLQRARELCSDLAVGRLEGPIHNEEKTEAEEDQEYIEELLNLIETDRFNITEVSKIQMRLKKRYGLECGEENTEERNSLGENVVEVVEEHNNDGAKSLANDMVEGEHEIPKTPTERNDSVNRVESAQGTSNPSLGGLSQHLTPKIPPPLPTCDQTCSGTPKLNSSREQYNSSLHTSNIQNQACSINVASDPCNSFNSSSFITHRQISSPPDENCSSRKSSARSCGIDAQNFESPYPPALCNDNESCRMVYNIPHHRCQNSQNETPSRKSIKLENYGIDNKNVSRPQFSVSPVMPRERVENTPAPHHLSMFQVQRTPCIKENDTRGKVFGSQNMCYNTEGELSFSNPKLPRLNSTLQHRSTLTPFHSGFGEQKRNSCNELCFTRQDIPSPKQPFRRTVSPHTVNEASGFDSFETRSPILDENNYLQINSSPILEGGDWQTRHPLDLLESRPRSHMSEGVFQSPSTCMNPRSFNTSAGTSQQSGLSNRSNSQMVLNLFPSFDQVPRNINSEDLEFSEDEYAEE